VEDVKPVLKKKQKTDFNLQPFWGGGFWPGWIVKYAVFIWFDSSRTGYHLVIGFRSSVCFRFVAVRWMANMRSFCFVIAFHNFVLHWKIGLLINVQHNIIQNHTQCYVGLIVFCRIFHTFRLNPTEHSAKYRQSDKTLLWLRIMLWSSWPVVISMKKKLAGPNELQQVCDRSNPWKLR